LCFQRFLIFFCHSVEQCYSSRQKKNLAVTKALKTLILSLAVTDLSVGVVAQSSYVVFLLMKLEPNAKNNPFDTTVNIVFSIVITLISYASVFSVVANNNNNNNNNNNK